MTLQMICAMFKFTSVMCFSFIVVVSYFVLTEIRVVVVDLVVAERCCFNYLCVVCFMWSVC